MNAALDFGRLGCFGFRTVAGVGEAGVEKLIGGERCIAGGRSKTVENRFGRGGRTEGADYLIFMDKQRHGLKVDGMFGLTRQGQFLGGVCPDDGIDDEAPIPPLLRAKQAKVIQNIPIKRHPGANSWWVHG